MSWTVSINGVTRSPEEWNIEKISGNFASMGAETMTLVVSAERIGASSFPYRAQVTLAYKNVPFFQGRVDTVSPHADDSSEGYQVSVIGPWADLEKLVYQQEWAIGSGSVKLPRVVIGMDEAGTLLPIGQVIRKVVGYAAETGIDIAPGAIENGTTLWTTQKENVMCSDVIREEARWMPDCVVWINHATVPPQLNVTKRANMTPATVDLNRGDMVGNFRILRRDDLKPDGVRIVYETAANIDGETYRDIHIDKAGPEEFGIGVLSAAVNLAGIDMQFQKQRVRTRKLPTTAEEFAKWFAKKIGNETGVWEAGQVKISAFKRELIPEEKDEDDDNKEPKEINKFAGRVKPKRVEDLPRELVDGSIEDWMRRKVGQVRLTCIVTAQAGADPKVKEIFSGADGGMIEFSETVTATNAVSKIYKGISQWTPAEKAPRGVAEMIFNGLQAPQFEGSYTLVDEEIAAVPWHASAVNFYGADPQYETAKAAVHSWSWDIESGVCDIAFGPNPRLGVMDVLEMQRMIRNRPVRWFSKDERSSNKHGSEFEPGSRGDTVGGHHAPKNWRAPSQSGGGNTTILPQAIWYEDDEWKMELTPATLPVHNLYDSGKPKRIKGGETFLDDTPRPSFTIPKGKSKWSLKLQIDSNGKILDDPIVIEDKGDVKREPVVPKRPTSGSTGTHLQELFEIQVDDEPGSRPKVRALSPAVSAWWCLPGIRTTCDDEPGSDTPSVRLHDHWDDGSKEDLWRGLAQESTTAIQESWAEVESEIGSGMKLKEIKVKVTPELIDGCIQLVGRVKVPVPIGSDGSYSWANCGEGGGSLTLKLSKGIVSPGNAGGSFEACGCDECGDGGHPIPGV
jgi:hypothetical protein